MVKLNLDTTRDAVEDLEEAVVILQEAITRRKATIAIDQDAKKDALVEETAIDTPFFKIKVESETEEGAPTLNELLTNERITEDELTDLFKSQPDEEKPKKKKKEQDSFIEIVEFDEEEPR